MQSMTFRVPMPSACILIWLLADSFLPRKEAVRLFLWDLLRITILLLLNSMELWKKPRIILNLMGKKKVRLFCLIKIPLVGYLELNHSIMTTLPSP